MNWRWVVLLFVGCASSKSTVMLNVPANAVVSTIRFTDAEIAANAHRDISKFYEWLERVEVQPREFTVEAPVTLKVNVDTTGAGFEALLEDGTLLRVPRSSRVTETITVKPRTPRDACSGPRLEKRSLEGRELCVYLPVDYSPQQKYPVVFVFPGFSGKAAQNDGFSARALFEKRPVILVGVETRVPQGTAYLNGEWEKYVVERVIPEIDRLYPTNGRRAAFGHSTGGWNALSLAVRHPELFVAIGASSPDPLDFDPWLAKGGARWFHWQRAEQRLGGRGQFTSWASSWSDGKPLFDGNGVVDAEVLAKWKRESPLARLDQQKVPMFITAGRKDMFGLFEPTERFVEAARAKKLDVTWAPTELDHFGETEARFTKLVDFLLERL